MKIGDRVKVINPVTTEYLRRGAIVNIEYTELYPKGLADVKFFADHSYLELEELQVIED